MKKSLTKFEMRLLATLTILAHAARVNSERIPVSWAGLDSLPSESQYRQQQECKQGEACLPSPPTQGRQKQSTAGFAGCLLASLTVQNRVFKVMVGG